MAPSTNPLVFFDISIGDKHEGRIVMELYKNFAPIIVENFRALCTGERDVDAEGRRLHFKGSVIHRVVPGLFCQGGDFGNGNGTGRHSIYGAKIPDTETSPHRHFKGKLSTAHAVPKPPASASRPYSYTAGSQFIICLDKAPCFDDKNLVFGSVVDGMDVLEAIGKVGSRSGTTSQAVMIANCGELNRTTPATATTKQTTAPTCTTKQATGTTIQPTAPTGTTIQPTLPQAPPVSSPTSPPA